MFFSSFYFTWGETQPKTTYNWSTYRYCNGSYDQLNNNQLTKYCNNSSYGYNGFTDTLTILLPEDDAATANWGSDWCMPTKAHWRNCIRTPPVYGRRKMVCTVDCSLRATGAVSSCPPLASVWALSSTAQASVATTGRVRSAWSLSARTMRGHPRIPFWLSCRNCFQCSLLLVVIGLERLKTKSLS